MRWGQSAYETDEDLAREAAGAEALGGTWRAHPTSATPPDLSDVDVLVVTSKVRVDAAVAQAMAGGAVLTTTSGVDHLDLAACAQAGVTVGRCPVARRDAVVEQAVVSAQWLLRRLGPLDAAARDGRWARAELPALAPRTLAGCTVGLVGLGVIGRKAAEAFGAAGARVLGVDPYVASLPCEGGSLAEVLPQVDVLSLHCALTPTSRGLIGVEELEALRPGAVVVNTARGESLDVAAAVAAVEAGRLGGLAVDVFPVEPYPALAAGAHPDVVFTPHSAGFTHDLGARVAEEVVASLTTWSTDRRLVHPVAPSAAR